MKLVIDIHDYDYRQIKEYYEKNDIVGATYSYIYHGIPLDEILDKIRAEVEALNQDYYCEGDFDKCKDYVLDIIDEYRGE